MLRRCRAAQHGGRQNPKDGVLVGVTDLFPYEKRKHAKLRDAGEKLSNTLSGRCRKRHTNTTKPPRQA